MEELNFNYNFQALDLVNLFREDKITQDEIIYVFEKSSRFSQEGGPELSTTVFIQIGYTLKKRIILIAYTFVFETIDFVGAKVADEDEIDNFYCGKG
ncbi:MAG: hypothetical protein RLZZ306_1593 [Bacteroidota bacterium]|jgi:hypothetical protein